MHLSEQLSSKEPWYIEMNELTTYSDNLNSSLDAPELDPQHLLVANELLAEVGIAPVITDLGEMEGDHPNAFVLDHHALKRIDQRKEIVTEYTNSEGFVLRNALPFHSTSASIVATW